MLRLESKGLLVIIFVMLSFFALSFAADAVTTIQAVLPKWLPLLGVALAIGFGLAAIAYALSSVFRLPELSVWAKTEVAELTQSAFLAVIILIVAGFSDSIFTAAIGGTPMAVSNDFLNTLVDKSFSLYSETVMVGWLMGSMSGIPPQYNQNNPGAKADKSKPATEGASTATAKGSGFHIPITFISLSFPSIQYYSYSGLNVFLGHFGQLQATAMTSAGLAVIVKVALNFINETALAVIVPLGVFMSIFTLTRKMGRTMIAIGICLYFFFPASVMVTKMMYESAYHPGTDPPEISKPSSLGDFESFATVQVMIQIADFIGRPIIEVAKVGGTLPFQALCVPEAAIIALPCTIAYPACFIAYLIPCVTFVKPLLIWPIATNLGEILANMAGPLARLASISGEIPTAQAVLVDQAVIRVPQLTNAADFITLFYINKKLADQLSNVVLDYTPYIMQYTVPVVLAPVVIIIILITAMRSISPAIGGEVQILGIGELV